MRKERKMKSYEIAKAHFDKLGSATEGQKELNRFDQIIEFDLKDDEAFYIKVESGKVSIIKGKAPEDYRNVIMLLTDRATVREIFYKGQLYPGLADFMFEGKVYMRGSKSGDIMVGEKGKPRMAWAAKLLRMHV